jgi:tRNA(adenine34) deaminase
MRVALDEARACLATSDVPVGAVVIGPTGELVGRGRNEREASADPTAHAEVLALRAAGRALGSWRLGGCTLVVTLEPCTMCAARWSWRGSRGWCSGAWDPKAGSAGSLRDVVRDRRLNHGSRWSRGVLADESSALLSRSSTGAAIQHAE